ncbi:MAG: AMP-binding protein [Cyanobacteria bacterium P01_F01_bin.150]
MVVANSRSLSTNFNLGQWPTLVDMLCERAAHQPQQIYRFLADGERDERYLTYDALDQQARAIAAHIQALYAESGSECVGERALMLYPAGLEFVAAFFGCLYAGVVPVPAYLPRNNRHQHRVTAIAQDAQAAIVMTTAEAIASLQSSLGDQQWNDVSFPIQWIATDDVSGQAESWIKPRITEDSLALLQYTSGATGTPKGVMVSHGNLLHNLAQIYQGFDHDSDSRGLSWLPSYHDMGLIGGILQPLYGGFPITLMAPVHFLQKPKRWLDAIARYGITSSGGPNFAYDLCIQKIPPEQRSEIDLSSWDVAFTGAEPVQWSTLERFAQAFEGCGFRQRAFYPCYGLAEATLFVTGGQKNEVPSVVYDHQRDASQDDDKSTAIPLRVSCGQPLLGQSVLVVHPDTCGVCDDGQVGEVWVTGNSVAQGYWQRADETEAVFNGRVEDRQESFLRTGDLGFISQGDLYITGRIKDVIIVRGQNHYPQDIEAAIAACHPALRQGHGAVFSVECIGADGQSGQQQIVVVQEVERTWVRKLKDEALTTDIMAAMRAAVSHSHALQIGAIALVKPNGIPKTSSGKIQRQQCKTDWLAGELAGVIKAEGRRQKAELKAEVKAEGRRQKAELKTEGGRQKAEAKAEEPTPSPSQEGDQAFPIPQRSNAPTPQLSPQNPKSEPQNPKSNIQNPKVQSLIRWLRDYADHRINSQLMDERRTISPHVLLDFGNQGLLGMQVPESYGGLALGNLDMMQVMQQLGAVDTTLALFVGLNNVLGIRPILNYGKSALKDELLPQLATGRELAAFALTEPVAGSNPRAIQTKAVAPPADSVYSMAALISGTKIWSGSAAWAGVINVFTQHQLVDGTWAGISGFVVRQNSPGLRQGPEALTMGMRSMVQNTVYLDQVPVESSQLLGQVGKGMTVAQDAMMYGRLAIAAASVGGMKRCVQLMVRYSSRRSISTGRLLDNPVTLTRLSHITMAITAVETLVNQIAQRLDREESVPMDAYTACKIAAPELFWQAADTLVQTLGGRGYIETNIAPQILRDARVLRIFEGPTETLEMFLGARLSHAVGLDNGSASSTAGDTVNDLLGWLRNSLKVPHIADGLMEAVAQIQHRFKHCAVFNSNITAQQYASTWIGKLATWATLWASVECALAQLSAQLSQTKIANGHGSLNALDSKELERSLLWIQQRFQSTLDRAMLEASVDKSIIPSGTQMTDLASTYKRSIGNIEQSLAGEDRALDSWLKRDQDDDASRPAKFNRSKEESDSDSSVRYALQKAPYTDKDQTPQHLNTSTPQHPNSSTPQLLNAPKAKVQTLKSIQSWLVTWLSDRLKIASAQIDRQKSFADYGIDSVMAVELAQDLEDWLGRDTPLDVTVAWNFPTIDALAEYLSRSSPNAISKSPRNIRPTLTKPSKDYGTSRHKGSTLEQATEKELAQLLAAEIAKVQQRGGR